MNFFIIQENEAENVFMMLDELFFIAPIDYRVEISFINETFCGNCSHFILI